MEKTYNALTKVMKTIKSVLEVISYVGMLIGTVMVVIFAVLRYGFNTGAGWSEEVIRILILFGIFCLCGNVTADGGMVRLAILYDSIKSKLTRKILDLIAMGTAFILGIFMFKWSLGVFIMAKGQFTVSTYLPKQAQYLCLPVSMALLVITMAIKIILILIEIKMIKNGTYEENMIASDNSESKEK